MLTAQVIPAELNADEIAQSAMETTFSFIAVMLGKHGYPVTGDLSPHDTLAVEAMFKDFVGAMALNNPEIAAMNEEASYTPSS